MQLTGGLRGQAKAPPPISCKINNNNCIRSVYSLLENCLYVQVSNFCFSLENGYYDNCVIKEMKNEAKQVVCKSVLGIDDIIKV